MLPLAAQIPAAKNDAISSETIEADAALAAALASVEKAIKLTERKKKFVAVMTARWEKMTKKTKRSDDESKAEVKRRKLDQLRTRKCEPGVMVVWHGGKGFGGIANEYIKQPDGRFIRAAQVAATLET